MVKVNELPLSVYKGKRKTKPEKEKLIGLARKVFNNFYKICYEEDNDRINVTPRFSLESYIFTIKIEPDKELKITADVFSKKHFKKALILSEMIEKEYPIYEFTLNKLYGGTIPYYKKE